MHYSQIWTQVAEATVEVEEFPGSRSAFARLIGATRRFLIAVARDPEVDETDRAKAQALLDAHGDVMTPKCLPGAFKAAATALSTEPPA